jgi:uncharacterized protein YjbI with pentapeptide repeats
MSKVFFPISNLSQGRVFQNYNLFNRISHWVVALQSQFLSPNFGAIAHRLESEIIDNNLAAIHDLQEIVTTQPKYQWVVIEILSKFVRTHGANRTTEDLTINSLTKNRQVIQAAISVIIKRDPNQDPEDEQLDLSYTDLRGVNLQGANLKYTNLYQSNLAGVNLTGANLEGAILTATNLSGANLHFTNLGGAILSAANLDKANLSNANLQGANLYLASLQGAVLNDAVLHGANLREARL